MGRRCLNGVARVMLKDAAGFGVALLVRGLHEHAAGDRRGAGAEHGGAGGDQFRRQAELRADVRNRLRASGSRSPAWTCPASTLRFSVVT